MIVPVQDGTVRAAAPAALALFAALGAVMGHRPLAVALPAVAVVVATAGFASWRQLVGWQLAACLLLAVAGLVVLGSVGSANLVWMGLCVVAAWVALVSSVAVTAVFGTILQVVLLAEWLFDREEPGWASWAIGTLFSLVACTFARRLRETVHQLRDTQRELAERTRAQERARIATEMHDVIGHALTVSLLHIGGARLALEEEPQEARRSLAEAEQLTRRSLEEVRATVGLMRSDAPGEIAPLPGATEIPELVESFRRAGADVGTHVTGELGAIGSARGLAAYRIVQEALTNATRHAAGEPISVRLEAADAGVRIVVANPLPAGAESERTPTAGSGLRGMRERARGVGGSVEAGALGNRWLVEAQLPV